MNKVKKAVIPCAGFGTRFLPATKAVPKEMFPIINVPTLQYIVDECVSAGITDILIILGKNKKCIEDHFDTSPDLEKLLIESGKHDVVREMRAITDKARICYVRQPDMKGSGAAILLAETFAGSDPFAVVFGDDIVYNEGGKSAIGQLTEAYETTGKTILGVKTMPPEEAVKYGCVIEGVKKGRYTVLKGLIEKPKLDELPGCLASMGRFVFSPDIFDVIRQTPPSANGEIYLTDAIGILSKTDIVYAYDFEGKRYDVGDRVGFLEANIEYGLRDPEIRAQLADYLKRIAAELD